MSELLSYLLAGIAAGAVNVAAGGGMLGSYFGAGIALGLPEAPLRIVIAGMGLLISTFYLARYVW